MSDDQRLREVENTLAAHLKGCEEQQKRVNESLAEVKAAQIALGNRMWLAAVSLCGLAISGIGSLLFIILAGAGRH